MQTFKVTFYLRSQAVITDDIYLDSLISSAKCKEIVKEGYFNNGKQAGDIKVIRNTLDPIIAREYDVYKCSKLFFNDLHAVSNYAKRFEHKYDKRLNTTKKIDEQRGFFKSAYNSLCYCLDTSPYAFCVGDIEEIQRLFINNLTFIGKKSSQGYGQIQKIVFEEIGSFPWIHKNQLVRNIPAKYAEKFKNKCECDFAEIPLISPYWRNERVLCAY